MQVLIRALSATIAALVLTSVIAAIPPASDIQKMSRTQLKSFLEGLEAKELKVALESVDKPTLKVGLINIDKPTLRIAVRIIDKPTLKIGLRAIDAPTLKIALQSMDAPTLKVAMESLDRPTLQVALTDGQSKIDNATYAVAWKVVDVATKREMKRLRQPPGASSPQADRAKKRLEDQLEEKLCIGNQGKTEITEFSFNPTSKVLKFKAKIVAKHDYGKLAPTVQATFTIEGEIDCATPGESTLCVEYPRGWQVVTGKKKDCITAEEIAAAIMAA